MSINPAALPLIAILRKGAPKSENGRGPGRDLDHFRVDFQPRFAHLADAFAQMYGPKPTEIPGVRFVSDEPFSFYYELWGQNQTLKARHDGTTWLKRWTEAGYNYDHDPIDPEDKLAWDCQPRGRMTFALPQFFRATGELGVFLMLTSSEIDASTIQSYLALLLTVGGTLNGIEFTIYREPRQFTVPITDKQTGEVKRSNVTKHMIYLKADPNMVKAELGAGTVYEELPAPPPPDDGSDLRTMYKHEVESLYAWADGKALTKTDLLQALDVEKISDWRGIYPLDEAKERVQGWLDKQLEPGS